MKKTLLNTLVFFGTFTAVLGQDDFAKGEGIPIENPRLFLLGLALVIIVFILTRRYFKKENIIKRKIKKTDRVSIQNFAEGDLAKVVGKALPTKDILIAPLTGKNVFSIMSFWRNMPEMEKSIFMISY